MERELINVYLFKTGEAYPISIKHMTFSDFKTFHQYIEQYGLNYDVPDSDEREKYTIKEVDFTLVKKDVKTKVFEVYMTFKKRE
ncbi:hypothetical protein P9D34_06045 [Bacillus swezeyi]|uniref:DUF3219 family protein n=1 Tax=Bacillus swezeyi TaxID=1925020 RepID=A0A1R1Q9U5_9BACI|nr:hypothetical protein [Bacillus swezeyi]MEC1260013.1 hypothetical protein [Bacillus swezeyi]MED2929755.1 hypothetical protein [Bacillus swezeyi]MED2963218.1 hypothetical protein [Bacillus swezeyi]MED3073169.1 hypothetical protein [Bacillus swezeyi]MED3082752.1 hypothetical protein [Bacillus swezeyi]